MHRFGAPSPPECHADGNPCTSPSEYYAGWQRSKRRVHLFHINAAVRHLRMAVLARARALWLCRWWQARQLIPSCTPIGVRSSPEPPAGPSPSPLPRFRCRADAARGTGSRHPAAGPGSRSPAHTIEDHRQRQRRGSNVHPLAPIVEGQRHVFARPCHGEARLWFRRHISFAMNLVAGHARNGRLVRQPRAASAATGLLRPAAEPNCESRLEVHPMAAQAIVHQPLFSVLRRIQQRCRCNVALCGPACQSAYSLRWQPWQSVVISITSALRNSDCFGHRPKQMNADVAQLRWKAGAMALHAADTCGVASREPLPPPPPSHGNSRSPVRALTSSRPTRQRPPPQPTRHQNTSRQRKPYPAHHAR